MILALLLTLPAQPAAVPPDLDQWVASAMRTFEVPGLARAVVKDEDVAWRRDTACVSWEIRRRWTRARCSASLRTRRRSPHTPALAGNLEHWQHDTFIALWRDRELRADAYVTFALNPDGSIDQVKMRAVSPATDFSFDFQDLLLKPVR